MKWRDKRGFSLIELMVALAIVSVVMAAIVAVFVRSSRVYTRENARAALQQDMRAALEVMGRDIRMACFDPDRTGNFNVRRALATHLRFTADMDEDGSVDSSPSFPDCEVLSYRYSAASEAVQVICGEGTGSIDARTLIGDTDVRVTSLNFDYRDNDGNTTSFRPDIRAVLITMTAEIPAGSVGMESRTYSTWVGMRNTEPNSSI